MSKLFIAREQCSGSHLPHLPAPHVSGSVHCVTAALHTATLTQQVHVYLVYLVYLQE